MATNDGHNSGGLKYDGHAGVVLGKSISFAYNTTGIDTGIFFVRLPKGAKLILNQFVCSTAFNAGTTNVFVAGYGASLNELVAAADVDETSATVQTAASGLKLAALTEDKDIYIKYTQTGTAASAGAATYNIAWTL